MRTNALLLTAPREISVQEIDLREIEQDEIIVNVKACGVCGTDLHMYHGDKGAFENSFPLVMGHEFSGVVSAVGNKVSRLKVGDHVAIDPNVYCGTCSPCLRGDVHFCENMIGIGTTEFGGFSEHCIVPEKAAYKVPEDLPFEYAAMVEPLSCCLHGIDRSGIKPGATVMIVGFGAIGQMMLQLSFIAGAAKVVVLETMAAKREKALEMGAFLSLDSASSDLKNNLEEAGLTHISSIIECVGKKETMELALDLSTPLTTVMLFGLTPPETVMNILPYEQLFAKEITLTASYINPLVADRVIGLLVSGRIDLSNIITDRIPLRDSTAVFTDSAYRQRGKILIGDF